MKWNKEQAVRRDWKFVANSGTFAVFVSGVLLLMQDENMNVTCYFDVLLNVNLRYCI